MKKDTFSIVTLLLANTIPAIGVVFWDIDPFQLIILYWLETVIIGLYAIARLVSAQKRPENAGFDRIPAAQQKNALWGFKILLLPLFLLQFSLFLAGLGYLIFSFFFTRHRCGRTWNAVYGSIACAIHWFPCKLRS